MDALKGLGADVVMARDDVFPDDAFDVVLDLVGGPRWPDLLDALVLGGRYVTSGAIAGPIVELDLRTLYLKGLTLIGSTRQDPRVFTDLCNKAKFTAQRPLNLAIMGVDWEENLGLGSEEGRGSSNYPGDAGLVMQLQDASCEIIAITDTDWRAQTFYVSPLQDRYCLVAEGQIRDSSSCSTAASSDGSAFSAAYWDLPADWMTADFDDSSWPNAVAYSNETVGVDNKPGYINFTELFDAADADASFIWSANLVLDNLVLLRKTIE